MTQVLGSQLAAALENSVAKYPALEGRFLQVLHSVHEDLAT